MNILPTECAEGIFKVDRFQSPEDYFLSPISISNAAFAVTSAFLFMCVCAV